MMRRLAGPGATTALLLASAPAAADPLRATVEPGRGVTLAGDVGEINLQGYVVWEAAALDGGVPRFRSQDTAFRFVDVIATARSSDERWTAAFVYDFQNDRRAVEDAWVTFAPRPGLALTLGNHKEPFSMQALNGSPDRTLAEAAIPQALAPDRAVGASLGLLRERWTLTAGAYGGNVNDGRDDGWSLGARGTWAPVHSPGRTVHLGVSVSRREPGSGTARFSAFPATVRTGRPVIDTGEIGRVSAVWRAGAELGVQRGPFLLQGEVVQTTLDRAGPNATLRGAYATASLALTGQARPYLTAANPNQRGAFGRLLPERDAGAGAIGAVEVVARASVTDLDDGSVRGGRLTAGAVGINWTPHEALRVTVEYIHGETDEPGPDERPRILLARLYWFL